jgi:signal peptidase I
MKKQKITQFLSRLWKQWRAFIFITIFVIIPVKSSLADWNWVPSGSMKPTILEGDLIFVDKLAYDLRFPLTMHRLAKWADPEKGDIIICFSPDDGMRLVKRIIALPGETIEIKNNRLYINGRQIHYTKIDPDQTKYLPDMLRERSVFATENLDGLTHAVMSIPSLRAMRNFGPVTVPDGKYFVMGDNRDNSRDSRYFGFVDRKLIVGKAKIVIGSFDLAGNYLPRLKRFFEPLQ